MVCAGWNPSNLAREVVFFLCCLKWFWRFLLQGRRSGFCSKVLNRCWFESGFPETLAKHTYLAQVITMITEVVPSGRGCSIALRSSWPLRLPQMWVTRVRNFCSWGSAFALIPFFTSHWLWRPWWLTLTEKCMNAAQILSKTLLNITGRWRHMPLMLRSARNCLRTPNVQARIRPCFQANQVP